MTEQENNLVFNEMSIEELTETVSEMSKQLFGLLNNYWIVLPLMFLAGFGLAGFSTMQTIIILNVSPYNKRGSVLGVLSAAIGTGPFGVLQIGLFAVIVGAQFSVFMSAFVGLVLITSTLLLTRKFLSAETFTTTVKHN